MVVTRTRDSAPTSADVHYRVRGALPLEALLAAMPETDLTRTSFDQRSRARILVSAGGYGVTFAGFRPAAWKWQEIPEVGRAFPTEDAAAACDYFNSLALSPGYQGPRQVVLER